MPHATCMNKITCAAKACCQPGDTLVDHGGVELEYCERHAQQTVECRD